jgi:hypothetical protein
MTGTRARSARRPDLAAIVARLEGLRGEFGRGARTAKRRLLRRLAARPIADPALLLQVHEALSFMRAYPDDPGVLREVEALLGAVSLWVLALPASARRALDETGLAGTTVYCPLSYAAARWLVQRFPTAVELDWRDRETEGALRAVLPFAVREAEEETLVEAGTDSRAWLAAVRAPDGRSDVARLLDRLAVGGRAGEAGRALYDQVQPRLAWALGHGAGSRTLATAPVRRVVFQSRPLLRARPSPRRRLARPRVSVRRAGRGEAAGLIDLARAAVTVRYREVHAFTFADPRDVVVADCGRGLAVVWMGVQPAHRLPLRAHYGYLLTRNGVPVGYGDASCLFEWCEIAFNVFDTFRGGESAFAFVRVLDFLGAHLGIRTFLLAPYQLGRGNAEAVDSGAFWFYAKLGFAPARSDLARLARAERRRLSRARGARSPAETLARLAEGRMALTVRGRPDAAVTAFDVARLARRVAASGAADRRRRADGERLLGGQALRSLSPAERAAFHGLAPILAAVPGLAGWPRADRARFLAVIRAKAGSSEVRYLRRMRGLRRLRAALLRLGATEDGPDAVPATWPPADARSGAPARGR